MNQLVEKLIWQQASPAPFESGWNLFAKILLLNQMKPNELVSLIKFTSAGDAKRLRFRSSDWIDLDKLALMLSLDPIRLRPCFFDQLQIQIEESYTQYNGDGIKVCPECLINGYHCIFFELSFITICPWHHVSLEQACVECMKAIHFKGFQFRKVEDFPKKNYPIELKSELGFWRSSCKHLVFEMDVIRKSNQMTKEQEHQINRKCKLLYGWIKTVQTRLDLTEKLFGYSLTETCNFEKIFNVAEHIAGECPWPVSQNRTSVKWITCNNHKEESQSRNESKNSKPSLEDIYGAIRRHIFTRYVRQHRLCHNSIVNLKRDDSLSLDTEKVCGVALAYSVWRLKIENFINIEALKTDPGTKQELVSNDFYQPIIDSSIEIEANLIFMQFFYIWELINENVGTNSIVINSTGLPFLQKSICSGYWKEKWSGVFPQPTSLVNKGFINCVNVNKKSKSLTNDRLTRDLAYNYHDELMFDKPGIMFKLSKFKSAPGQHTVKYINL